MQQTALYSEHLRLNAKMVEFAGWQMPIQYLGLRQEHLATRTQAGLFDVSHMGEIRVRGAQALASLQWMTSNDVAKLKQGEAQYSLLTLPTGGVVDDIIVYCLEPNADYLVCVNAANCAKDWEWMQKNNRGADLKNESELWSQIAVQGPRAWEVLETVFGEQMRTLQKPFQIRWMKWKSESPVLVASTGYTGERGVEIFVENDLAVGLWQDLLKPQVGGWQASPIGLGARDTLRTEMKYPLYGHELSDSTDPISAGLSWVVKPKAKDFIGREAIVKVLERGPSQALVGLKMLDRGIPRQGYPVLDSKGEKIGVITSGTHSPSLDEPIGIAYVDNAFANPGSQVQVEIRGRGAKAQVVPTPFVQVQK